MNPSGLLFAAAAFAAATCVQRRRSSWGDAVHLQELSGSGSSHDVEAEASGTLGEAGVDGVTLQLAGLLSELWDWSTDTSSDQEDKKPPLHPQDSIHPWVELNDGLDGNRLKRVVFPQEASPGEQRKLSSGEPASVAPWRRADVITSAGGSD